jgi:hypothetical protein
MRHASRTDRSGRRTWGSLLVVGLATVAMSCASSKAPTGGPTTASPVVTSPVAATPTTALTVTSTLDGQTTLPQRVSWVATPSVPDSEVSEVDFLIDEQIAFVEEHAPYAFGRDGGYLVTSFLTPGEHSFDVRVISVGGQTAESKLEASVAPAPTPPEGLDQGPWTREMTAADLEKATSSEPPPTGAWGLVIDSVGWMVEDPMGGGLLFDVGYVSDGKVELRASIEQPPFPSPTGGAFCEEPDPPALWSYTIGGGGTTLTLHPVSQDPCGDRLAILEGTWKTTAG